MNTPTPETPAGGLTTAEQEALREQLASWFGDERQAFLASDLADAIDPIIAARVAAAVVQARAEDRAHIEAEALRAAADIAAEWDSGVSADAQAFAGWLRDRAAALTATEDGHRP